MTITSTRRAIEEPCYECGGPVRRVFSVSFPKPMVEHWNSTVGKPIRTERQFADELKRASAETSERLGHEHRFVPIDPSQVGATHEGLDNTFRQQVATGQRDTKLIL